MPYLIIVPDKRKRRHANHRKGNADLIASNPTSTKNLAVVAGKDEPQNKMKPAM